ncbi:hypothetical protein PHSY_002017 [Pseudozyma hubeiensis SY62]|uniref:Uncharacterized protein n=1 Tax=Pseudozyma hubeiensis (strain SY62) TaxID=1305764 RepID=R9P013_PSEHS|nr:hypothetical protein PHSY_002017 [Pseudozyma hubeiensis SY62]GAC94446.1 hypothetical protein PHSY_002017 [Pseudozyma hubeiensis SY62]
MKAQSNVFGSPSLRVYTSKRLPPPASTSSFDHLCFPVFLSTLLCSIINSKHTIMSVIKAPPSPSSETSIKQTPSKVDTSNTTKADIQTQGKADGKPFAHRVRRWWEMVLPEDKSIAANAEAYLQDTSKPWSQEGFQHVLTPSKKWRKCSFGTSCLTEDVQDEIILAILKRIRAAPEPNILTQPIVHFDGHQVYVSLLTTQALLHLWQCPPIFRDHPMEFVSKGLFYENPKISHFKQGTAMSKDLFVEQFRKQYKPHFAVKSTDSGLRVACARFYEVSGIPGGPVFSGEVLMFSNELDTAEVHKPFFVKASTVDMFSFSRPSKIRAAEVTSPDM